jgi:hypothetical protein
LAYFEVFFSSILILPVHDNGEDMDVVVNVLHLMYKQDMDSALQEIDGIYRLVLTLVGNSQKFAAFKQFYENFKPVLSSGDPMEIDDNESLMSFQTDVSFLDDTFSIDEEVKSPPEEEVQVKEVVPVKQPLKDVEVEQEFEQSTNNPVVEQNLAPFSIYCDEENEQQPDKPVVKEEKVKAKKPKKKKIKPLPGNLETVLEVSESTQNSRMINEEDVEIGIPESTENITEMKVPQSTKAVSPTQDLLVEEDKCNNEEIQSEILPENSKKVTFRDEVSEIDLETCNDESQQEVVVKKPKKVTFVDEVTVLDDGLDKVYVDPDPKLTWWEKELWKHDLKLNHRPKVFITKDITLEGAIAREEARHDKLRQDKLEVEKFKDEFEELWKKRERDGQRMRKQGIKDKLDRSAEKDDPESGSYKITRKLSTLHTDKSRRKIAFDCDEEPDEIDEEINAATQNPELDDGNVADVEDQQYEIIEKVPHPIDQNNNRNATLEKHASFVQTSLSTRRKNRNVYDLKIGDEEEDESKLPGYKTYAQTMRERRGEKFNPDLKELFNQRPLSPNRPSKVTLIFNFSLDIL